MTVQGKFLDFFMLNIY